MGRVSRMLKAVTIKPEAEKVEDEAPADEASTTAESKGSGVRPAAPGGSKELARLIACWPRMPEHFKQTVLTLVEVTERL